MAWALKFDGVNDYIPLGAGAISLASGDVVEFNIINFTGAGGSYNYLMDGDGSRPYLAIQPDGDIEFNTSVMTVKIDGVPAGSLSTNVPVDGLAHTITATITNNCSFGYIGSRYSVNDFYSGQLSSVKVTTISGLNDRWWDATASDHSNTGAQIVLVDTVSNSNATGVNFPTDGSAWVDLGGGGTTGSITQTTQSFNQSMAGNVSNSFTGTITQNTQAFTQSASGSAASPAITGTINQITTAFTQSAIGDVVSSGINGSITQLTSAFTQSAIGSSSLNISGVITQTSGAFTQSVTGTVAEQIAGTINQSVSSFTMSAIGVIPASWYDRPQAVTAYANQAPVTTTWSNK